MVDFQLTNQFGAQLIAFEDITKVGVEIYQMHNKLKTFYYVYTRKHDTMVSGIESDRVAKINEFNSCREGKPGNILLFPARFSVYCKKLIAHFFF